MASDAILDFEALLRPISDEDPCGPNLREDFTPEERAQLVAMCVVPDPRVPLVDLLQAAEDGGKGSTPHGQSRTRSVRASRARASSMKRSVRASSWWKP